MGPEIVIKALKNHKLYEVANPVVVGSVKAMNQIKEILGIKIEIRKINNPVDGCYSADYLNIIDIDNIDTDRLEFGKVQSEAGKAAFDYINAVVKMAIKLQIEGIATTPINKEAIKAASIDFIGHTEMLAELTGKQDPLTMFQVNELRVFFLSRHVSLKKACDLVKKERIVEYIERCVQALAMLGLKDWRIAVAGLNPHSGEHGLFGNEEVSEIEPAVELLKMRGFAVEGPVSADSVFYLALNGRYDAVLSLYHDQGHIATKMVDFEKTVAVTIGLPFIRTSVDHGTAFDIAGKNMASSVSMEEAIRVAALYSINYSLGLSNALPPQQLVLGWSPIV